MAANVLTAGEQQRIATRTWFFTYCLMIGASGVLGLLTMRSTPAPFTLPLTLLLMATAAVMVRPIIAVYLIAFLILFTDGSVTPWFPFGKNLSSRESILFVADGIIVSPLELLLVAALVSWLLQTILDRRARRFVVGGLFKQLAVFTAFLAMGFVLGVGTGGDRYVAVWELRPILYLPGIYLLITNLFTTRRQYRRLAWWMLAGLVSHSLFALEYMFSLNQSSRRELESLVGHPAAVQMNIVLFLAIAAWLVKGVPGYARLLFVLAAIPVGWVYLVSERRAAIIGLGVGMITFFMVLSRINPRGLRVAGPIFFVITVGYLGAFWSNESSLGFPAQAVKTVIASDEASEKDQSSDLYRVIENYDIVTTVKARPLTGFGFGQKFLRPIALPDISFFPFYEFIPHNSILWIWIKGGIGAFLAMFIMFGRALQRGFEAVIRLRAGPDALLVCAAASYLVMYIVFAYVDIAWDGRSMIVVGAAMAICSELLGLPPDDSTTSAPGAALDTVSDEIAMSTARSGPIASHLA